MGLWGSLYFSQSVFTGCLRPPVGYVYRANNNNKQNKHSIPHIMPLFRRQRNQDNYFRNLKFPLKITENRYDTYESMIKTVTKLWYLIILPQKQCDYCLPCLQVAPKCKYFWLLQFFLLNPLRRSEESQICTQGF